MEERRKFVRYRVEDLCIITHSKTVGTIHDISMNGLSCYCLKGIDCEQIFEEQIDIFCKLRNVLVEKVKIKILGSEIFSGEFVESIRSRKCRVVFEDLTEAQSAQLQKVISAYENA